MFNVRKTSENEQNPDKRYFVPADARFQIGMAKRAHVLAVKHFGAFMILNSVPDADGEQTLRDNRSREYQDKVLDILKIPPAMTGFELPEVPALKAVCLSRLLR